ncbi:hypothetical protein [Clostridium sp.]|jgi:hypothetical protein|uniref:hypothetical protein n=1 Tax=Clostridium sp. TaxID=1506 RepID=UPI003EEC6568
MKVDVLSFYKRILITQSLSILFAVISNFHTRILINRDLMFDNQTLFLHITLLVIIFSVIIIRYLDGRWINILLISIPYIVYWLIVLAIASTIFPTHTDSENYGAGIILLFVSACQWISVVIGSIIGTYIKKRTLNLNK